MELEDVLALEGFSEAHGGLKRNGEMCFDAESLDELLKATRKLEREACAKVCETIREGVWDRDGDKAKDECAAAIRMRSNAEVRGGGATTSNETSTASPPSP